MKRTMSLLLAMVMLLTMAACGQPPVASTPVGGTNQMQSSETAAVPEKIIIEYWHRNSETAGGPMIDQYAAAFNSSQDKYEVKPVFMTDAYKGIIQQLQAEAAAGHAPGVVQIGYAWLNYLAENHNFADVKTLEPEYLNNYLPNIIELCTTTDGRVAGIPYSFSCPVIYYNTELLAKAGLDTNALPQTVDELYDWARTVKSKTGQFGLSMAAAGDFWLEQWEIESNGGRMINYNSDGKMVATFASPEGIEAMQKIADLITKDKAATYVMGEPIKEAFTSGNIGMIGATIGWSQGIKDGANFEFVTGPLPVYPGKIPRVPVGGNFLAITAQTPEEQAGAWEWTKYLTTQQGYFDWTVNTGYVPPRKDVEGMPEFQEYLKENPLLNACLEQIEDTVPFVAFPGDVGLQIEQGLLDVRDTIMNGEQTAQEALIDMQNRANELMEVK